MAPAEVLVALPVREVGSVDPALPKVSAEKSTAIVKLNDRARLMHV